MSLRPPVALLLLALLVGFARPFGPQKKDPDEPYRMRIAKWHTTALLVRTKKRQNGVKDGFTMKVADDLATGKKAPVEVFAGAIGYQWIGPDTAVRYASFRPVTLDPRRRSEVEIELRKGEIRHRTGPLGADVRYGSRSGPRLASSKGTAYALRIVGGGMEVLVAEGEVRVSLAAKPGETLVLPPRTKAILGRTLPARPTPATPADEKRLRALLSLPIKNLIGYTDAEELRRRNAQEIVTLRVRPAFTVERVAALAEAIGRAFSLVATDDAFWSIDEEGVRRSIGKGLRFVATSPNGEAILGADASGDLIAQDLFGKGRRIVATAFKRLVSLAPDGKRAAVIVETRNVFKDVTGRLTDRREERTAIVSLQGSSTRLLDVGDQSTILWRPGGRPALSVAVGEQKGPNGESLSPASKFTFVNLAENLVGNAFGDADLKIFQPFVADGVWNVSLAPSGDWIFARSGEKTKIIDLLSGAAYDADGATALSELPGGTAVLASGPNPVVVFRAGAGVQARPATPADVPLPDDLALSPNGELVAFRDSGTRTETVADSVNLARRSDTYVGFENARRTEWICGDELLVKSLDPDKPDPVLIKLGIKRFGARPLGFGGAPPPRPLTGIAFGIDAFPAASEVIVSDVAANGTLVGFTKTAFGATQGRASASFIVDDPLRPVARLWAAGDLDGLPMEILDDGTVFAQSFVMLPDGRTVAVPQSLGSERSKGIDAQGRVLFGESIWDPRVRNVAYPVGDGSPYGGSITPLEFTPPVGEAVAMNRSGTILWVDREGSGRKRFWIGKARGKAQEGETPLEPGISELGEDGNVYCEDSSSLDNGKTWRTTLARYRLNGPPQPLLREPYDGQIILRGITKAGIPYGDIPRDVGGGLMIGDKGFVIVGGELVVLDDLLPPGYKISSIRRITDRGDVAGDVTKDGKPVGFVPNLNILLKKRK